MLLFYSAMAALCFATGGWLMKLSQGVTRLWPSVGFLVLFIAGALLQATAMRIGSMGVVYLVVLGLEAVFAVSLAVALLGEKLSVARVLAMLLILAGAAILRRA